MAGRNRNACQAQKETIDVDKAWASHVDTIDNKQMRQHGRAQDDSNSGDKLASVRVGSEHRWRVHEHLMNHSLFMAPFRSEHGLNTPGAGRCSAAQKMAHAPENALVRSARRFLRGTN